MKQSWVEIKGGGGDGGVNTNIAQQLWRERERKKKRKEKRRDSYTFWWWWFLGTCRPITWDTASTDKLPDPLFNPQLCHLAVKQVSPPSVTIRHASLEARTPHRFSIYPRVLLGKWPTAYQSVIHSNIIKFPFEDSIKWKCGVKPSRTDWRRTRSRRPRAWDRMRTRGRGDAGGGDREPAPCRYCFRSCCCLCARTCATGAGDTGAICPSTTEIRTKKPGALSECRTGGTKHQVRSTHLLLHFTVMVCSKKCWVQWSIIGS